MGFFANCTNFFQNPSFEGCQSMAASEGNIQNKPSKSPKFSRETSEPEFRYSLAIGFTFPTNFAHQSETCDFMILTMNL